MAKHSNIYYCTKCKKWHISNKDRKDYRNHKKYAEDYKPQRKW